MFLLEWLRLLVRLHCQDITQVNYTFKQYCQAKKSSKKGPNLNAFPKEAIPASTPTSWSICDAVEFTEDHYVIYFSKNGIL